MIEKINSKNIKELREGLENAIDTWAKANGLKRTDGFNIEFSDNSFRTKSGMFFVIENAEEAVAAKKYGFDLQKLQLKAFVIPHEYKTQFTHESKTYELIKISTRSPKYPFIAKRLSDGQTYKFPVGLINKKLSE